MYKKFLSFMLEEDLQAVHTFDLLFKSLGENGLEYDGHNGVEV